MYRNLAVGCAVVVFFFMGFVKTKADPLVCSPIKPAHFFVCNTDVKEFGASWDSDNGTRQLLYQLWQQYPQLAFLPDTASSSFYGREKYWVHPVEYNNHQFTCQWYTAGSGKLFGSGGYVHGFCSILATDFQFGSMPKPRKPTKPAKPTKADELPLPSYWKDQNGSQLAIYGIPNSFGASGTSFNGSFLNEAADLDCKGVQQSISGTATTAKDGTVTVFFSAIGFSGMPVCQDGLVWWGKLSGSTLNLTLGIAHPRAAKSFSKYDELTFTRVP